MKKIFEWLAQYFKSEPTPLYLEKVKIHCQPDIPFAASVMREMCKYGATPSSPTDAHLLVEAMFIDSNSENFYYRVSLKSVYGGTLWAKERVSRQTKLSKVSAKELGELAKSLGSWQVADIESHDLQIPKSL